MATKEGDVEVIREGLTFARYFTTEGRHPFEDVEWEIRDAVIPGEGGNVFEQKGVEVPAFWSMTAYPPSPKSARVHALLGWRKFVPLSCVPPMLK